MEFRYHLCIRTRSGMSYLVTVDAPVFSKAFPAACRGIEAELGLDPFGGLRCVAFDTHRIDVPVDSRRRTRTMCTCTIDDTGLPQPSDGCHIEQRDPASDRGCPAAQMIPVMSSRVEALVDTRMTRPAIRGLSKLPAPVRRGRAGLSTELDDMRHSERF